MRGIQFTAVTLFVQPFLLGTTASYILKNVCVLCTHVCVKGCVAMVQRKQPQLLVLDFLPHPRQGVLFATAYIQGYLTHEFPGISLSAPAPPCKRDGIKCVFCQIWFSMGSGNPNSYSHTCTHSILHTESSPQPCASHIFNP